MKFNEKCSNGWGDMERTRKCYRRNDGRMDGQTDGQMNGIPLTPMLFAAGD